MFTLVPSGPGSPSGPSGPSGPYATATRNTPLNITQQRMSSTGIHLASKTHTQLHMCTVDSEIAPTTK